MKQIYQALLIMFAVLLGIAALTEKGIADTTVVYQGILHTRLGSAQLTNNGDTTLSLYNLGSSGNDGVIISLPDSALSSYITTTIDSGTVIADSAIIETSHYAKINGIENSLLGTAYYQKVSPTAWEFFINHSSIGATVETLKVFRNDTLIFTQTYNYSLLGKTINADHNLKTASSNMIPWPKVGTVWHPDFFNWISFSKEIWIHNEYWGHTADISSDPSAISFTPAGTTDTLLCDHIEVVSNGITGLDITEPYVADFKASGIQNFNISSELFELGDEFKSTTFQGVPYTRLGNGLLVNQGDSTLFVRNLGSSGNDGIRISIPDTANSVDISTSIDSNIIIPNGAVIQRNAYATMSGIPNSLLGTTNFTKTGLNTWQLSTNNTPVGVTAETLKVYRNDTLVHSQTYSPNSVIGSVIGNGAGQIGRGLPMGWSLKLVKVIKWTKHYVRVWDVSFVPGSAQFDPAGGFEQSEFVSPIAFDHIEVISSSDSDMVQQPYYEDFKVSQIPSFSITQQVYQSLQFSLDPVTSSLCAGDAYKISWSGGDPAWSVNMSLIDVNAWTVHSAITSGGTPNDGSYVWTIPSNIPDGLYQVYIAGGNPYTWRYGNSFTISQCDTCVDPPANMVAWWPLDETSGTTAEDIVSGFNGTSSPGPIGPIVSTNGPAPVSEWPPVVSAGGAKVGSALYFWHQFSDRHISVPDNTTLRFGTTDFSIDAWVFITQYSGTTIQPIVEKMQYTGTTPDIGYRLFLESGVLTATLAWGTGDTTIQVPFVNQLSQGAWHHVVLTVDRDVSNSTVNLYIDGASVHNTVSSIGNSLSLANSEDLIIGGSALGNLINYLDVGIDEVELFDTVLTPGQIQSLFEADSLGKCKSYITGMKFNDANGNQTIDVGETGISNWTMFLKDGNNNIRSTVTDVNGNYSFACVPGNYSLFEEYKPGWVQTAPLSVVHNVSVLSGQTITGINFGNADSCVNVLTDTCYGGVADTFSTANGAELSTPSAALSAVTGGVFKGFDDNTQNRYFLHTFSCWSDTCIIVGAKLTFRVRAVGNQSNDAIQIRQNGTTGIWVDFLSNLPGAGGTWNNQTLTVTLDLANLPTSSIAAYTNITNILASLQDGDLDIAIQDDSEVDFMNLELELCCPTGLEGVKFNDLNGNQIKETGENGISNWTIFLDNTTGTNITSTVTDAQGAFKFENLNPGSYSLREEYKSGWTQTAPLTVVHNVALQVGQTITGLSFGNVDSCLDVSADTCFAGVSDSFSTSNGSEPSSPSAALSAVTGGVFKGFDDNTQNRYFLHTFNCWSDTCVVVGAKLTFRVRAVGDQSNDAIQIRQNATTGVWVEFLANLPGAGGTWNNQTLTVTLDLANLPTSSIAAYANITNILASLQDGDLDIAIQDDSEVDFMNLELELCCPCGLEMSIKNNLNSGWNLVSVPLIVPDFNVSAVYPSAVGNAFYYQGGYVSTTTMDNCRGYWLKFDVPKSQTIIGNELCNLSCLVNQGWNIIGSSSEPVDVSSIQSTPSGIISSAFFGYNNGYFQTSTIEPGKGYWVKTNSAGKLLIGGSLMMPGASAADGSSNHSITLTINDASSAGQSLFIDKQSVKNAKNQIFEMPPLPPAGVFDARFSSQKMVEVVGGGAINEFPIMVTSAQYPVVIHWDAKEIALSAFLKIGEKTIELKGKGSVEITNLAEARNIKVIVMGQVPTDYVLHHAYPNPFNPTTSIAFGLPIDAQVTLKVFDVLGKEVAVIEENQIRQAGTHVVEFNAARLASGMYFYRITAQSEGKTFTDVKKMMLLK